MASVAGIRKRLLRELERLPEDKLQEVLEFVHRLLPRTDRHPRARANLKKDPLLTFIGGISHGTLARDIDRELYGEPS